MKLLERYRDNVRLPVVNLDMDDPLSLMRQSGFMFSEHPLAALSKTDPGGAKEIMRGLVHVENRKVDLGFAALELDLRKAELAVAMSRTTSIVSAHIEQIKKHPNKTTTKTVHRRGWFDTESITSKSW